MYSPGSDSDSASVPYDTPTFEEEDERPRLTESNVLPYASFSVPPNISRIFNLPPPFNKAVLLRFAGINLSSFSDAVSWCSYNSLLSVFIHHFPFVILRSHPAIGDSCMLCHYCENEPPNYQMWLSGDAYVSMHHHGAHTQKAW